MRPIKWKGIRSGLTICCQKISPTNLQSYSCIMKLKIINFGLFFKMRSRDDFPLDSSWFVCLWPTQKCKKSRSDIILVTNPLSESSVCLKIIAKWRRCHSIDQNWVMIIKQTTLRPLTYIISIFCSLNICYSFLLADISIHFLGFVKGGL